VVHRLSPFIIRLKDREVATCTLQLADGYDYAVVATTLHLQAIPTPCLKKGTPASSPRLKTGASAGEIG
jgi:hypothetical protein